MTMQHQTETALTSLTDNDVADYLRKSPDFFNRHKELLEELHLTHAAHGAVSLIERQVAVLRDANRHLKKQLHDLVTNARDNDRVSENMRRLTLELFSANSLDEVVATIHRHLTVQFQAEALTLILFDNPKHTSTSAHSTAIKQITTTSPDYANITALVDQGLPLCGKLKSEQLTLLFGEKSMEVASAAVIPLLLPNRSAFGVMAIGSSDPKRFHISMGTLFLIHMGEIVSQALLNQSGR